MFDGSPKSGLIFYVINAYSVLVVCFCECFSKHLFYCGTLGPATSLCGTFSAWVTTSILNDAQGIPGAMLFHWEVTAVFLIMETVGFIMYV